MREVRTLDVATLGPDPDWAGVAALNDDDTLELPGEDCEHYHYLELVDVSDDRVAPVGRYTYRLVVKWTDPKSGKERRWSSVRIGARVGVGNADRIIRQQFRARVAVQIVSISGVSSGTTLIMYQGSTREAGSY